MTNKLLPKIRVVVADSHPSIRENLRYLLDAERDMHVVGVAKNAVSALQITLALLPDVLVIDYDLPDYDGLATARALHAAGHSRRVVLYTMTPEVFTHGSQPEIDACVSKDASPKEPLQAIRGERRSVPQRRPRVLVVEDDDDIRSVMRAALEEDGLTTIETGNAFEALAECERQPPTVVVLDLGLPQMSGQEFVTAYRQLKTAPAPIVVVSAQHGGRAVAAALGAAAFLPKPFHLTELVEAVRRVA
jgi:DNA-binding NarL/FixJ family response regulator